jgi:outer membrane protein assembly complex protein YaeT
MRSGTRGAAAALLAIALLCAPPAARAETAVRVAGNAAISAKKLRAAAANELKELEDPARRRAAAADASFQMESAGRRLGYAFIEVDHEISGEGAEAVVTFTVREGPLVRLGEISFSGNVFFPAGDLRPYFSGGGPTPYVKADIDAGRRELLLLYRNQGFPAVEIGKPQITFSPDRSVADVRLEITEGNRLLISGVVFEGDALPEGGPALQGLASSLLGQPYYERRQLALANAVTEGFSARGYPDATVAVREGPGAAAGDVVLHVSVASGPRVRISEVTIAGNKRTRSEFIRDRIPVKAGGWFNEEKIHDGFRELYRAGIFSRVNHSLEGEGAERILRVEVEEAPAREVSVEIGWGSYEQLRGRVGFRDRNFLGTGHSLGAEAGASTKGGLVKGEYLWSWFLGTKLSLSVPLSWSYREEPTYTDEEVELSARLYRLFSARTNAGLKYSFRYNHLSHLSPDVPPDARDEEYTSASLKANLDVDRRDTIIYPTRGWKTSLAVEVADQMLGGTLDYVRCTAGAGLFQPLGAGFILGLRLDTGFIVPTHGSEDIPVNERFFTGGDSSVRSFEEQQLGPKGVSGDPLGGLASTVASIEVRRRILHNLAASVFADFGNVAPNRSLEGLDQNGMTTSDQVDGMWEDYLSDFRAGLGFGLQYLTPVGPARLDLAWNPDPRLEENEADFAWHFSFGMAF